MEMTHGTSHRIYSKLHGTMLLWPFIIIVLLEEQKQPSNDIAIYNSYFMCKQLNIFILCHSLYRTNSYNEVSGEKILINVILWILRHSIKCKLWSLNVNIKNGLLMKSQPRSLPTHMILTLAFNTTFQRKINVWSLKKFMT